LLDLDLIKSLFDIHLGIDLINQLPLGLPLVGILSSSHGWPCSLRI